MKNILILLSFVICHLSFVSGQEKAKYPWDFSPQARKTLAEEMADSAKAVVRDSIAVSEAQLRSDIADSLKSTYIIAASNASADWKRQANAICDGTADQTEIQTAMNLGHNIILTEGTYILSSTITPKDSVSITGQGNKTILDATGINTSSHAFLYSSSNGLNKFKLTNIRIKGKKLDSGSITSRCFYTVGAGALDDIIFDHITIEGFYMGITIENNGPNEKIIISNSTFKDQTFACTKFENTDGAKIINNYLDLTRTGVGNEADTHVGIWFVPSSTSEYGNYNTIIQGNTLIGAGGESINSHAKNSNICNNIINNGVTGIALESFIKTNPTYLQTVMDANISGNIIKGTSSMAIRTTYDPGNNEAGLSNIILNHNIMDSCYSGIHVGTVYNNDIWGKNIIISNNIIKNTQTFAYLISHCKNVEFSNNIADTCDLYPAYQPNIKINIGSQHININGGISSHGAYGLAISDSSKHIYIGSSWRSYDNYMYGLSIADDCDSIFVHDAIFFNSTTGLQAYHIRGNGLFHGYAELVHNVYGGTVTANVDLPLSGGSLLQINTDNIMQKDDRYTLFSRGLDSSDFFLHDTVMIGYATRSFTIDSLIIISYDNAPSYYYELYHSEGTAAFASAKSNIYKNKIVRFTEMSDYTGTPGKIYIVFTAVTTKPEDTLISIIGDWTY